MKKIIGILVLVLLIAGGAGAFYLSQQQQDIRQEAANAEVCSTSGADIMLVIDISGSMLGATSSTDTTTRMVREKEAANIFVDKISANNSLLPNDRKNKVGLSTISNRPQSTSNPSKLVIPMTEDMNQVKSAVDSLVSVQNNLTCIECGIVFANNEIAANSRNGLKKVVVLMTDGVPNQLLATSKATQAEYEQAAMQAALNGHNSKGTVFYIIGLGTDVNTSYLTNMAQQTGGKYYAAPTANDLDEIYREIEETLGKAAISGTVYNDLNNNKVKDTTENGLAGWTVNLKKSDDSSLGSAQTNTAGAYLLEGVCDGGYKVELTLQSGWEITSPTNPSYHSVAVQNGLPVENINFGVFQGPALTFTGSPLSIVSGGTSTLTWSSVNTTSCTASNGWTGQKTVSGTQTTLQLTQTTTFTLSCTGPSGTVEKSITVNVQQASTPTPTLTKTPTPTLTQVPTSTPIPTAVPTSIPTNTPEPSATPIPQGLRVSFTALLDGIGSAGDSQNPTNSTLSNKNPLHPTRDVVIEVFDSAAELVGTANGTMNYSPQNGNFVGSADFGTSLSGGNYLVKIKSPQYLRQNFTGITTLTPGDQPNALPLVTLIAGDVNGDNVLSILDYNLILGCYSDLAPAKACTPEQKLATDINDDGNVNQLDYNLFLRELSRRLGS